MSGQLRTIDTSEHPDIDFEFRPASYWEDEDVLRPLVASGSPGTGSGSDDRRLELRNALVLGLDPGVVCGPSRPSLARREVTIAQLYLRSMGGDVISICARPSGKRIAYRVVDGFSGPDAYRSKRLTSVRPLTLRQLIELMENCSTPWCWNKDAPNAGLVRDYWFDDGYGTPPEEMIAFVEVHSDFYPELADFYEVEGERHIQEVNAFRAAQSTASGPSGGPATPGAESPGSAAASAPEIGDRASPGQAG